MKENASRNQNSKERKKRKFCLNYDSDLRPMMTNATHMMRKPASGNSQALPEKQDIAQFKAYLVKQMQSVKNEGSNLRRINETVGLRVHHPFYKRPTEVSRLKQKIRRSAVHERLKRKATNRDYVKKRNFFQKLKPSMSRVNVAEKINFLERARQ